MMAAAEADREVLYHTFGEKYGDRSLKEWITLVNELILKHHPTVGTLGLLVCVCRVSCVVCRVSCGAVRVCAALTERVSCVSRRGVQPGEAVRSGAWRASERQPVRAAPPPLRGQGRRAATRRGPEK